MVFAASFFGTGTQRLVSDNRSECAQGNVLSPAAIASTQEEQTIAIKKDSRIVETPTEARQAEPGPSVLLILIVSVGLALIVLGTGWFVFFRT